MYKRQRSKASKLSMMISIALHLAAFIGFAFVKFLPEKEVHGAEVGVSFVDVDKTRLMKRSLDVRAATSLKNPVQHRSIGRQASARVDYRSSSDFYVSDTPVKMFSEVRSLKDAVVKGSSMQRPTINTGRDVLSPSSIKLRQSSAQPVHTGISGGHELFGKSAPSELVKPDIKVTDDTNSVLQVFFTSVREEIESKKKYPPAARDAGLEGRSGVKMVILKDGQLEKVVLVDSSGHEILDKAALQSVRDAAPFPPIPQEIGRDRLEVSIYLVFKIT